MKELKLRMCLNKFSIFEINGEVNSHCDDIRNPYIPNKQDR